MSPRIIATKIGRALLTMLLAMTFVFIVLRLAGDPARMMLPDDAPEEQILRYHQQLGLDRPLIEQYFDYLWQILHGDFGISYIQGLSALSVVAERLPATLLLGGTSFLIVLLVGIPLGALAALKRGSFTDKVVLFLSAAGYSLPTFFFAVLLILVFAVALHVLPTGGIGTWQSLILPCFTASLGGVGVLARFTRSAMLEVLGRLHVRAARAHGLSSRRIVWQEVLPNAAIPTVTVIGFTIGGLVAGSVVIESVFAWPGVGQLLQMSVSHRDLPVVQVIVLMIAATMTVTNLCVDLLYGWLDPRIADARAAGAA
ncbi:MAG TPA: ABC transporter permease [Devosiaceae bacterium]|jgi:peptide/nickel transport system permease protein